MSGATSSGHSGEERLLAAAQTGEEPAFAEVVEPYRSELTAHCYRMLGSLHDAEDAVQETLLRAWKALARFEGRSSLRSWLYRIATNVCLTAVDKRDKRIHPVDYGPSSDPADGPGEPLVETVWIEPFPDDALALPDGAASPEARFEQRESVELAFVAAMQHLPPRQRAVLILREVLGYSARETAATIESTEASVNSALQRARATISDRLPDRSQQQTLRALGDEGIGRVVGSYIDAWDRGDVDGVVSILTEDACFSMPPLASWYGGPAGGHEELRAFFNVGPLSGEWRWRHLLVRSNNQPAFAFYAWSEEEGTHLPFALNVLTIDGERISDLTCFVTRSIESSDREALRALAGGAPRREAPGRLLRPLRPA